MDREEMLRQHCARVMGDVEGFEGAGHPFLKECKKELGKLDNVWGVKRDESRGGNKEPLLNQGEWAQLMSHNIDA